MANQREYYRAELTQPRWSQGEIARASEIDKKLLLNLATRRAELFNFVEPDQSRGRIRRLYSTQDALMFAMVAPLVRVGVAPAEALNHAKVMVEWICREPLHVGAKFKGLGRKLYRFSSAGESGFIDSPEFDSKGASAWILIAVSALAQKTVHLLWEPYSPTPIESEGDWEKAREKARLRNKLSNK